MSEAQATDGGPTHQDPPSGGSEAASEGGDLGDGASEQPRYVSREEFERLDSKLDLLNDGIADFRNSFAQQRQQQAAPPPEEDDYDPDEPATMGKITRAIRQETARVSTAQAAKQERAEWDKKAASEFPLNDPKFESEFRKQWRELSSSGMNVNHPRAVYTAAKLTSQVIGQRGGKNSRTEDAPLDTEQPGQGGATRQTRADRRKPQIEDGDPRVVMYNMKGNKSKDQLAKFKEKLAAQDARKK